MILALVLIVGTCFFLVAATKAAERARANGYGRLPPRRKLPDGWVWRKSNARWVVSSEKMPPPPPPPPPPKNCPACRGR
jgi:hypothetical protein